jgi:hypothetical protein
MLLQATRKTEPAIPTISRDLARIGERRKGVVGNDIGMSQFPAMAAANF